ncbi:MAG: penicillin-binding protein 2 [candidate division Zixibacteria bacterium]
MIDGTEGRRLNHRLLLLLIFAAVVFIFAKLAGMQIFSGTEYRRASEQNGVRVVPISAPRGVISDRNNRILVKNRPSYSMYLVPYEAKNIDSTAARLAEVLGREPDEIRKQIRLGWQGRFQPIRLKRDVEFNTVCFIEEHSLEFPGVIFQVEPTRLYPESNFGSHIWGYIGEVTEGDLAGDELEGYSLGDFVGKEGLEKQYEWFLRGQGGLKYLEVTAGGKIVGELPDRERIDPVRGSELIMEIDWELQEIAERELAARGSGAVVGIDPRNGAVRVLCSVPDFDANLFSGVISPEEWKAVMADSLHPLFNRSIKGTYPPGSTMKLFTAAMGLENEFITEISKFESCVGAKRFGNRSFRCWKPAGHGKLDLIGAIIQSCDVYFYQLGVLGGVDSWSTTASANRFGIKTGIDLPGEFAGLVPTAVYFDSRYGVKGWTKYLVLNLAIGQGELLVTPTQMAVLFAALGNDGIIYKPRLISRIISPIDSEITIIDPEIIGHLDISDKNLAILLKSMIGVIADEHGTARRVALDSVTVAGKTGTAQNPHGEDHAWFTCFAPAESPELALAVIVENSGHGGSIAAPLAKRILEKYFEKPDEISTIDLEDNHE